MPVDPRHDTFLHACVDGALAAAQRRLPHARRNSDWR